MLPLALLPVLIPTPPYLTDRPEIMFCPPPPLILKIETTQRPEWAAASSLFNWAALLVPVSSSSSPPSSSSSSSSFYKGSACLPPSRAVQRQATLQAFLSFLPSALPSFYPSVHILVVTDGDGRRHYGFLAKAGQEANAPVLLLESSFPSFAAARTLLQYLIRHPSARAIETLIVQGLPVPLPGVRVEVSLPRSADFARGERGSGPLITQKKGQKRETSSDLLSYSWPLGSPLPEDECLNRLLLVGMSPQIMTRLWLSLLLEKKVAITTRGNPQLLPLLCEVRRGGGGFKAQR